MWQAISSHLLMVTARHLNIATFILPSMSVCKPAVGLTAPTCPHCTCTMVTVSSSARPASWHMSAGAKACTAQANIRVT